jgi:hypothetical protein
MSSKKSRHAVQPTENKPKVRTHSSGRVHPFICSLVQDTRAVLKSVPVLRRHPAQPNGKFTYNVIAHNPRAMPHIRRDLNEQDDDFDRYSLRPNLSLLNVSNDPFFDESDDEDVSRAPDRLYDVFHSTKIDDC